MNVLKFGEGKLGAVNGMTRAGDVEIYSLQSEEIWTGVTYSLASTMIMEVRRNLFYLNSDLMGFFLKRILQTRPSLLRKESMKLVSILLVWLFKRQKL